MLDEQTYPDKNVVKFAGQVVPLKIDLDQQPEVGAKFSIEATPTIMFLEPSGKVIGSFLGFRAPKEFVQEAEKVLKKRKGK